MADVEKGDSISFPCVPAGTYHWTNTDRKVLMENRPWRDKITGVIFACIVLAQLCVSFALIGSVDPTVCGTVDPNGDAAAVANDIDKNYGFGPMMELYIGQFIGLMFLIIFVASVWLGSLIKFSRIVTWGTLILDICILIVMAVGVFVAFESMPMMIFFALLAVAMGIYFLVIKQSVNKAAVLMGSAAKCLEANPSLMGVNLILMFALFGYLALVFAGIISSFLVWDCVDGGIGPDVWAKWASNSRTFLALSMTWTFFTMNMLRSYVASATTAMWCWHGAENIRYKPFKALKWALTTSFGSMASAGLIVSIIDYLTKEAKSCSTNCSCAFNPLWWCLRIALCIYKDTINAMCRYALCFASITGEGFWTSSERTLCNLRGKFGLMFKLGSTASLVLYSGAVIFALTIAFIAFAMGMAVPPVLIGADENGDDGLNLVTGVVFDRRVSASTYGNILAMVAWTFGLGLMYYPLVAILVCTMLTPYIAAVFGYAFVFAVFVGALANYMLVYFAGSILDVTGALFCIGLITKQNELNQSAAEGTPEQVVFYMSTKLNEGGAGAARNPAIN